MAAFAARCHSATSSGKGEHLSGKYASGGELLSLETHNGGITLATVDPSRKDRDQDEDLALGSGVAQRARRANGRLWPCVSTAILRCASHVTGLEQVRGMFHSHRLFFRQFRENFHTTGSIAPSSRWLAQALARFVAGPGGDGSGNGHPRRILEVGPGTGAVTHWILPDLGQRDRLDLVEMNDQFVAHLHDRFNTESTWQDVEPRTRILHMPIQDLAAEGGYDAIVSGLPLNNFSGELVEQLLQTLVGLSPGGTLSFFEYVAVRQAKLLVARGDERTRLAAISGHLGRLLGADEFRRDCVLRNVPPAWVHHVRVG